MRWTTVGIFVAFATSTRAADPPPVSVGVAQIDITPTTPIRLAGYGSRKAESEGVAGRLRAKALAIGADGEPGPVLLLTVENCGVPATITEEVARRLEGKIRRARLTVASSHTHTGPCLSSVLPYIFGTPIPADQMDRINAYSRDLVEKLVSVALSALEDRKPGRLAWGRGTAGFAANRRVLKDGKWTGFGVNPDGPVDHSLPMLRVTGEDGSLRAVFLSYACHCTTLDGSFNQVHGDWIGFAQDAIERDHPGALALIAVGCGADTNPEPRTKLEQARQHGEAIAAEVNRLLKSGELKPLPGAITTKLATIALPFAEPPSRDELARRAEKPGAEGLHARDLLARLDRGESLPRELDYVVQTWSFGNDLAIVFLAGEVVVDYAIRLNRELDARRLWVIAYANDVPCYIASKRILQEGGYEADLSMVFYGRPTRLAPEAEDRIIETVRGLLPGSFARREKDTR
jgi:hypothetical protein